MNYIKFFFYEFLILTIFLAIHIYLDQFTSKPFTYVDLIAICVELPIWILNFNLLTKLFNHFPMITNRKKIALSIFTFLFAALFLGLSESIYFELTGKMIFY
ncbi:MAG: hypothetical protein ACI35O_08245 [Bacillaceae bacterium]